jgi:hypothetical protein
VVASSRGACGGLAMVGMTDGNYVQIAVRLDKHEAARVEREAKKHGRTFAQQIRHIVEDWRGN